MDTVGTILVWASLIFGLGLVSYGFYGYITETIIPLWRIKYRDNNTD